LMNKIDALSGSLEALVVPDVRARVIVVPALPGSWLGHRGEGGDETIWFEVDAARNGRLFETAYDAGSVLEPLGLVGPVYLQMMLRLRLAGYEVTSHPYDWRRPLRDLGRELADRIRDEGREVHVVAQSYGGLVARAALLSGAPGVGEVVMLGTPNYGCFGV